MSASRVVSAEGMDVDEAGVALPTPEWMEAARKAADTDGILENASAKRQKVCISCNTLTSPAHANHAQECTQRRESLQETRVRVARSCKKERKEEEHQSYNQQFNNTKHALYSKYLLKNGLRKGKRMSDPSCRRGSCHVRQCAYCVFHTIRHRDVI